MTSLTTKYISSIIFLFPITMLNEPCIPVMMRLAAEGRTLVDAERIAALIVLPVILLWAMMGIAAPALTYAFPPGQQSVQFSHGPACRVIRISGLLPVVTGTAGSSSRTFLQE
jgi:hypothetical protein